MEKKLKDVLHFYMGCQCCMTKGSYHAVHELHLVAHDNSVFELTGKLYDYFSSDTTKAELKPFLRPLSSMTEDEKKECDKQIHKYDSGNPASHHVTDWAYRIDWLLKNHFDIFQLIPAGLAIDATSLPQQAG